MIRLLLASLLAVSLAPGSFAQVENYKPVTEEMLRNPAPGDWLSFSRTLDAQRYSPLNQINRGNVKNLALAWSRGLPAGNTEGIPLVHDGVMYVLAPGAVIQALNGSTGDLLWEYKRPVPQGQATGARTKTIAIYQDIVVYTAPDGFIVGLDARTGELRWETNVGGGNHTSGPIIANGKAISGRACGQTRESCFIAAHDVLTGKELWRFYTVPAAGEPGYETWGNPTPETHAKNMASTWGIPGSYDAQRNLVIWGVANPMPNTRADRHDGKVDAIPRTAPADLYSNSTIALNPDTGKLVWYYQHLPGDDWDEDYTNERVLTRTKISPDPKFVKWANPNVPKGQERDVSVMIGEGGGIFVNDRATGEFLWATPFPFDTSNFLIKNIDVQTGKTEINWDVVLKEPGERHTICFWNTRSYWPTSYSPRTNSLYTAYIDNCLDMTRASADGKQRERRTGTQRPGGKPEEMNGLAKINLETGEIIRFNISGAASTGAMLATAGDVVFNGDVNRRLRAFDAETGEKLWETIVGGPISVSTITYAAGGKQYVAVITGDNLANGGMLPQDGPRAPRGHNAVYVFALPN